jgi:hypothetical protein
MTSSISFNLIDYHRITKKHFLLAEFDVMDAYRQRSNSIDSQLRQKSAEKTHCSLPKLSSIIFCGGPPPKPAHIILSKHLQVISKAGINYY